MFRHIDEHGIEGREHGAESDTQHECHRIEERFGEYRKMSHKEFTCEQPEKCSRRYIHSQHYYLCNPSFVHLLPGKQP